MHSRILTAALVLLGAASVASAQDPSFLQGTPSSTEAFGISCGDSTAYQQPLDAANFGNAQTTDEQPALLVSEDIVDGGGVIVPFAGGATNSLRIWGLSIEFDGGFVATCLEDVTAQTPFNVAFYADNAGVPDAVPMFTTTAVPTVVDTGIPFAFTTILEHTLALDAPAPEGYSWISIQRQTGEQTINGTDCYFLWVDETAAGTYDDMNFTISSATSNPADLTMCVGASPVTGGGPDDPVFDVTVPTASTYGLMALAALLAGAGFFAIRRFR